MKDMTANVQKMDEFIEVLSESQKKVGRKVMAHLSNGSMFLTPRRFFFYSLFNIDNIE